MPSAVKYDDDDDDDGDIIGFRHMAYKIMCFSLVAVSRKSRPKDGRKIRLVEKGEEGRRDNKLPRSPRRLVGRRRSKNIK